MTGYREADLSRLRTVPVESRGHRLTPSHLGRPPGDDRSFRAFLDSLPHQLAADHLREVAAAIVAARRQGRGVLLLVGGHVIKVGLGPLLTSWIADGTVTHIALNGAAAIHDYELAAHGGTSEDVESGLADGSFGMARETGRAVNLAARRAAEAGLGLGEALAADLAGLRPPGGASSVLAACHERRVPVTIHVAIGAEVTHQHPDADGAALGAASHRDFRRLAGSLDSLHDGGVVLNLGSAVLLPEVFLKALAVARNLGDGRPAGFVAADFDMIRHYRPRMNVVERPTRAGGKGYLLTGHHEILIPLLAWSVREAGGTGGSATP